MLFTAIPLEWRGTQLAAGTSGYSPSNARSFLENLGAGLWDSMIPDLIKEQFWAQHANITAFTIASAHDVVPWELLYPLARGHDNGFLAEQFPVLRRVHGQHRSLILDTTDACFVVPPQSPANAAAEVAALRKILRTRADGIDTIGELADLQRLIDSGHSGLLHFVCHNTFDAAGGRIGMAGGPFIPALLNRAAEYGSLRRRPLIFLNACTSAVNVPEYTTTMGWARQFMRAGAGAFIGTAWDVRSQTAQSFAEAFYTTLSGGATLGQSTLRARQAVCGNGSDPTWLAYTIYGDPQAHTKDSNA